MFTTNSIIAEVHSNEECYGLGVVDSYGAVHFMELSKYFIQTKTHKSTGMSLFKDRFRYNNGLIEWTDIPSMETKQIVQDYLTKRGYPVTKQKGYWDNWDEQDVIAENYNKSLSDDEQHDLAVSYFNIGHDNSEDDFGSVVDGSNYCWIWSKPDGAIRAKKGGTHSTNFGQTAKEYTFSGWFDEPKNTISIVFPEHELRKLGNRRPTVDDIPQQVYQALIRTFGKRKPKFVVFENLNEGKYDVEDEELHSYGDVRPYGGWIDPDAGFHPVAFEQHATYARAILDQLGRKDYKDTYHEMYSLGFIRIAFSNDTMYYRFKGYHTEGYVPPTPRKIKAMKDLALDYNCKRIVDCDTNKEMSDFVPAERPDATDESVISENQLVGLKYWWMDGDRNLHPVKFEEHRYWAAAYLTKIGYKIDVAKDDVYKMMFKLGFVRLVKQRYGGEIILSYQYTTERPLNSKQLKEIKDLAIEEGCDYLNDENTRKETPLQESYKYEEKEFSNVPFKSWWIEPNGKIHDIDDGSKRTHWGWARDYLNTKHGKGSYGNDSPSYVLFDLGWVRLAFNYFKDGTLHFDTTQPTKLTNTLMRHIKDHAIEIHASALVDDNTRKSIDLLQEAVTMEKEKEVKGYLSRMNDDTIVVTVNKFDEMPAASYVQVDGFWNKENVFSSNPEDLAKWGFLMPSTKQLLTLPTGKYKLGDAKKQLRQNLNEIFKPDGEMRWWLDASGQLHDVKREGHSVWGAKYITNRFGDDSPATKYANSDFSAPYQILFGAGWIRLLHLRQFDILEYEYDKAPTHKLMSIIKDLGKKLKVRALYNIPTGKTESLTENISEDMSYDELVKLTTPERKDRAVNVTARSLPVSTENGLETWNFRYKSSPQTTVTDKPIRGSISFLKGKVGQNNNAMKMKCKVDCECPDFMYRFAYNDAVKGASQVGPDSLNGALNRRPKPAYDYGEGLCKHLVALGRFLKTKIQATKKSNLFEAIDEVSKQGPFNVTYYD